MSFLYHKISYEKQSLIKAKPSSIKKAAKLISSSKKGIIVAGGGIKYNSNFPSDYNSIKKLKGIGDYTAAAISSFCFKLPYAVLDGNVFRILARYFLIDKP